MERIETLLRHLHDHYVFPEVATRIEAYLRPQIAEYAALASGEELSQRLTDDLRAVAHDKHMSVRYSPESFPPEAEGMGLTPEQRQEWDLFLLLDNAGFHKVERLAGNVGYLKLNGFAPPEIAAETAIAAMALLSGTEALIIDLRDNGGGSPHMVALLCSYFFPSGTHLNDLYWRDQDRTDQFWTLPYVPGKRYLDKPVYVLASSKTFSGGEEFCYNLQSLKRATIVGETTGGGAHPVGRYQMDDHFEAFIPVGRAINPITGTNWEGAGVMPDTAVPAEEALKTAYAAALKQVIAKAEKESGTPWQNLRQEAQKALSDLN